MNVTKCGFLVLLCLFGSRTTAADEKFVILIDAGSTGSRIHVHPYSHHGEQLTIKPSHSIKIKPGLSSFAKDPSGGVKSLQPLFMLAREKIPKSQWASVPVLVQATAGLRSIDPADAERVLEAVRDDLQNDQPFAFERGWAEIISGQQEGVNGWLAVNYLLGNLEGNDQTTGVIEMGGASMQVTFEPDQFRSQTPPAESQIVSFDLPARSVSLYTHSYLGYGLEEAMNAFQRRAVREIQTSGNPCFPKNLKHSAAGNFGRCEQLVQKKLFPKENCSSTCSFNGVYMPDLTKGDQFFAIENFFYTTDFFSLSKSQNWHLELPSEGEKYCSKDWDTIITNNPQEPVDALEKYCFATAYETQVLKYGLGLGPNFADFVSIARTIKGTPIDWALGAVYAHVQGVKVRQMGTVIGSWRGHTVIGGPQEPDSGFASYVFIGGPVLAALAFFIRSRVNRKTVYGFPRPRD